MSRISNLQHPMSVKFAAKKYGIPEALICDLAKNGEVGCDQFVGPSGIPTMLVEKSDIEIYRMDGGGDGE